jgi:diguanylate cyclase (GGDEF)-like protein
MISQSNTTEADLELSAMIEKLHRENQSLRQENQDLKAALSMTAEHGDAVQAELHNTNRRLQLEIEERLKAEATLRTMVDMMTRQKEDLEIIVQTLMEHGDVLDKQWHQKFQEASQQADIDGLTQIPNRRRFDAYFTQQWKQMTRERSPLAIIMCDIDAFKVYNDTYGHLKGDTCLQQIATALCRCLQRPGDMVARYGGEEFIALLPQTNQEGATMVAERMQEIIRSLDIPHASSPVGQRVTVSIGIASLVPDSKMSRDHLLRLADDRLYQAKRLGKNRIVNAFNHASNAAL